MWAPRKRRSMARKILGVISRVIVERRSVAKKREPSLHEKRNKLHRRVIRWAAPATSGWFEDKADKYREIKDKVTNFGKLETPTERRDRWRREHRYDRRYSKDQDK
jgi:hypothetical protein